MVTGAPDKAKDNMDFGTTDEAARNGPDSSRSDANE
jgi:hypothetical protein